jgi:hypothetical protein
VEDFLVSLDRQTLGLRKELNRRSSKRNRIWISYDVPQPQDPGRDTRNEDSCRDHAAWTRG